QKTGPFPGADPIQTQPLFTVDDPAKYTLMYLPVVNWTRENGFMAGMAFHNGFILPKPVEYFIMPFYAFGNNDLAGFGRITYNITPYDKLIRMAAITLEGTQFAAPGNQNYQKVNTGVDFYFRNRNMINPITQKVFVNYIAASSLYQIELQEKAEMNYHIRFGYQLARHSIINPFTLQTSFESGKSYRKTSVECNYRLSYYGRDNGLDIRLFSGIMLNEDSKIPFYSFSPGGRSGRELNLFQGTYPDRFAVFPSNFWSRQMSLSEGGLVSPVNDSLGYSRWLVSLSFTSSLPGKISRLPVKPFINLLLNDKNFGRENFSPIFFEAGLKTGIPNIFEIYVPLLVSNNIDSACGSFRNRIRFVFSLDSLSNKRVFSK
ncbi:MAG: hypothetical protein PHH93_10660, partial [Prolixibacteraceae bacterium]|nr:hypothetical protein [Prolixibacteraceae bacterium]